jgi:hypothetical protein
VIARLAHLVAFTDQARIHDAIANGVVDAFAVDQPIMFWAHQDPTSRWYGKIELLPTNLAADPWYYTVGVSGDASSYRLLNAINAFIAWFSTTRERQEIERRWQGGAIAGSKGYADEGAGLMGEAELAARYAREIGPAPGLATIGDRYRAAAEQRVAA